MKNEYTVTEFKLKLFERFLPYALALGVEQHWMEKFAGLFMQLEGRDANYHPAWYHGQQWRVHNLGSFSYSLGSSLGSALSCSSAAPGCSSGSGGGGSSGGGGRSRGVVNSKNGDTSGCCSLEVSA